MPKSKSFKKRVKKTLNKIFGNKNKNENLNMNQNIIKINLGDVKKVNLNVYPVIKKIWPSY